MDVSPAMLKKTQGFTLVELSIAILIIGVMAAAGINAWSHLRESVRVRTTQDHMEIIADAMSAYAVRNNRIPCPALPGGDGTERGATAANNWLGNCAGGAAQLEGVVPYVTLGLSNDFAKDGWGNFITYRVSLAYTRDPENAATNVHRRCRTDLWTEALRSVDPLKARFCCTGDDIGANEEVSVNIPAGAVWIGRQAQANMGGTLGNIYDPAGFDIDDDGDPTNNGAGMHARFDYADLPGNANEIDNVQDEVADNFIGLAYYTISHGSNGVGAFTVNGNRIGQTNAGVPEAYADGGNNEQANANSNSAIATALQTNTTTGVNYFDDIVYWQTNAQLMARIGGESCLIP